MTPKLFYAGAIAVLLFAVSIVSQFHIKENWAATPLGVLNAIVEYLAWAAILILVPLLVLSGLADLVLWIKKGRGGKK